MILYYDVYMNETSIRKTKFTLSSSTNSITQNKDVEYKNPQQSGLVIVHSC